MIEKEIKEKLNKLLDGLLDKVAGRMEKLEEAIHQPCKIHVDNDGTGTKLDVEGCRLTLLLTLVGTEKNMLKQLNCSNEEFELLKNLVGTQENTNE